MEDYLESARYLLSRHVQHGMSKKEARSAGIVCSVGSERTYRQGIANYLGWCDDNGIDQEFQANKNNLLCYLEERSEWVKQKTLDSERAALKFVFKQKLKRFKCEHESLNDKRSCTYEQFNLIVNKQSEKNKISSWLSFFSGLRAHELATILPIEERSPSSHRTWDSRRFLGLPQHRLYTVEGKGGLVRAVAVPLWLSQILEQRRRPPVKVVDREIFYLSHYEIGFGQLWSQSFSQASKKALGYSTGGHGLRHSFAKWRLHILLEHLTSSLQLEKQRNILKLALLIVSQELGHFRLDIVFTYLR